MAVSNIPLTEQIDSYLERSGFQQVYRPENQDGFQCLAFRPEEADRLMVIRVIEDGRNCTQEVLREAASVLEAQGLSGGYLFTGTYFHADLFFEALSLNLKLINRRDLEVPVSKEASETASSPPVPPPLPNQGPTLAAESPRKRKKAPAIVRLIAGLAAGALLVQTGKFLIRQMSNGFEFREIASLSISREPGNGGVQVSLNRGSASSEGDFLSGRPIVSGPGVPTFETVFADEHAAAFQQIYGIDRIQDADIREVSMAVVQQESERIPFSFAIVGPEKFGRAIQECRSNPAFAYIMAAHMSDLSMKAPLLEKYRESFKQGCHPLVAFEAECAIAEKAGTPEGYDVAFRALEQMLESFDSGNGLPISLQVDALFSRGDVLLEENPKRFVQIVADSPHVDDWIKHAVLADSFIMAGWKARGTGWGHTVSAEARAKFQAHLEKAASHLELAWAGCEKKHPYPAARMLVVARGANWDGEVARYWFEEALSAQFDYKPAYQNYASWLTPRWHGSDAELKAFGTACLETGRFDTDVPLQLLHAHRSRLWSWGDPHDYWKARSEQEKEEIRTLLQGMLGVSDDPRSLRFYQSVAVVGHFVCGDYRLAQEYMDDLGEDFDEWAVMFFKVELDVLYRTIDPDSNSFLQALNKLF